MHNRDLHPEGITVRWRGGRPAISAAQREICRRFGAEPLLPQPRTMIGLALTRPRTLEPLNALRHPVTSAGNGWFVWRGPSIPRDDDQFFSPLHVEHLDVHAPELAPYLALPPGWGVVLAPGYEDVWYDANLLDI
ncbi:hypothetical protein AB0M47_24435 [Hamadaea sp. NPDC051192]|uniref:immunity protein Imm33 domain-containing protein n=1 Tax=Hamadaea sp. NPDC051192 TaxID=3154940 RepID=UPI0034263B3C